MVSEPVDGSLPYEDKLVLPNDLLMLWERLPAGGGPGGGGGRGIPGSHA